VSDGPGSAASGPSWNQGAAGPAGDFPVLLRADLRAAEIAFHGVWIDPIGLGAVDGRPALRTIGGESGALRTDRGSRDGHRPNLVSELCLQDLGRVPQASLDHLAGDVAIEDRRPPKHLVLQEQFQCGSRLVQRRLLILAVRVGMTGQRMHVGSPAGMIGRFQLLGQLCEHGGSLVRSPAGDQLAGVAQDLILGRSQRVGAKKRVGKGSEYGSTSGRTSILGARPGRRFGLGLAVQVPDDVSPILRAPPIFIEFKGLGKGRDKQARSIYLVCDPASSWFPGGPWSQALRYAKSTGVKCGSASGFETLAEELEA